MTTPDVETPPEAPSAPVAPPNGELPTTPPATLWEALSVAQGLFPIVPKLHHATVPMKSGGQYSYDYADLGDILDAVRPILRACGLSVVQPIKHKKDKDFLVTRVIHISGQSIKSRMRLTIAQATPQATGSLITYFRRYAFCTSGVDLDQVSSGRRRSGLDRQGRGVGPGPEQDHRQPGPPGPADS
jgi:hypothetical protein